MIDPYPYEWPLIIPKSVGMYAMRFVPRDKGVSGFLCLGRLFQGQPNEAALCI